MNEYRKFLHLSIKDKIVYRYKTLNDMLVNNRYDKVTLNIIDGDIKHDIKKKGDYYKTVGIKDLKQKEFEKQLLELVKH